MVNCHSTLFPAKTTITFYNTTKLNVFDIPSEQPGHYNLYENDGKDVMRSTTKNIKLSLFQAVK